MIHPPQTMQGTLWSAPISSLDIEDNRVYIIHQVLAFGILEDVRWLFQTYSKKSIRKTFLESPVKTYTRAAFNFSKLLLDVNDTDCQKDLYDRLAPRHLG